MAISDAYLILYNTGCCILWAIVLKLALPSIFEAVLSSPTLQSIGDALSSVYAIEGLAKTLTVVQMAALMEIIHAATGIVRSPLFVTTLQVGSRIAALYSITFSPESQGKSARID